ncbi:FLICE-associated huge protein isoform X2 [Ptiloglossa arizonensis]
MYAKTNDYFVHKSIPREVIINTCHKPTDIALPPDENKQESYEIDSLCISTKDPNLSKSTLTPITVFGERLRKRIADEQNLERKDKQPSKFAVNGNSSLCVEKYVAESDKENGSLRDTNSCNTREIQSLMGSQYSENDSTKSSTLTSKIIIRDFLPNNKNEIDGKLLRKSTLAVNYTGKRANDDPNKSISVKRIKYEGEEYFSESTNKEANGNICIESKEKHNSPKCNKFESFDHFCEVERVAKSSNIEPDRKSNAEVKKHGCLVSDTVRKDEKKYVKDENGIACNKKYVSKRHYKFSQTPTFTLDERDTGRCNEIGRKDDYRTNNVEHYRAKQKEDRRATGTNDYRSRIKSTSYKNCREEKYIRNKYNKHVGYGERFEKYYDFRSINADKAKLINKETCDSRNTMKRSSMDRKTTNVQTGGRYDNYGSRRLKSADRTTKRDKKQDEINDYSTHWKTGIVKSTGRSRHAEILRRDKIREKSIEKRECVVSVTRVGRPGITEREPLTRLHNAASTSRIDTDQLQDSKELEDGEIATTPVNSLNKNNKHEESRDHKEDHGESSLSVVIEKEKVVYNEDDQSESVRDSNVLNNDISKCLPTVTSSDKQCQESIENVENVENIEKFIRNYAFNGENLKKAPKNPYRKNVTSQCSLGDDDVPEHKKNFEKPHTLESNVYKTLTFDEKQEANSNLEPAEPSQSDTFSCDFKDFPKNECVDMQMALETPVKNAIYFAEDNKCAQLISIELLERDCLFDRSAEKVSGCLQMEKVFENTTEDSVLRKCNPESYEKECNVNDANDDVGICKDSDTDNGNLENRNNDQNIHNDCGNNSEGENKTEDTSIARKSIQEKQNEIDKHPIQDGLLREFEMLVDQSNITNAKDSSTNVHGKIVLFARRKKPVCLANNNANMTVLINNNYDASINPSDMNNITECNSVLKLRTCRRSRREESGVVGT